MYLDTAILVKLVIREPDSFFYASQTDGQAGVWSAQIAYVESFAALLRKERERSISARTRLMAWDKLLKYFRSGMLELVPPEDAIVRRANRILLRCHPRVAIRSLDALHLASCEAVDAFPLLTNDLRMRAAATHLRFPLGPVAP